MTSSSIPYRLTVDGFAPEHFRVHSFCGKEALSEAWSFDVMVTCDAGGDAVERAALGQRATLLFDVAEEQRAFYGIVAAVHLVQVHQASEKVEYRLRLVPRLWLLKRKQRTRIFQNMRVTDVVTAVLAEAGIAARWQLTRAYPMREYVYPEGQNPYPFSE